MNFAKSISNERTQHQEHCFDPQLGLYVGAEVSIKKNQEFAYSLFYLFFRLLWREDLEIQKGEAM